MTSANSSKSLRISSATIALLAFSAGRSFFCWDELFSDSDFLAYASLISNIATVAIMLCLPLTIILVATNALNRLPTKYQTASLIGAGLFVLIWVLMDIFSFG
jgi:hypothetical protein